MGAILQSASPMSGRPGAPGAGRYVPDPRVRAFGKASGIPRGPVSSLDTAIVKKAGNDPRPSCRA